MPNRKVAFAPVLWYRDTEGVFKSALPVGGGVTLGPTPPWALADDRTSWHKTRLSFVLEYSDGIVDPEPREEKLSPSDVAYSRITLANLALWLVKPTDIHFDGFAAVELSEGEGVLGSSFSRVRPLAAHDKHRQAKLTSADVAAAARTHETFRSVPYDGACWSALTVVRRALMEDWWEGRYLLFWTAMEALFGTEEAAAEVTYRLSQRAAFFLSAKRAEAASMFAVLKKGYGWRSKVVHGMRLRSLKYEQSVDLLLAIEEAVRSSLVRILADSQLIATFSGKDRDTYLDGLVFAPEGGAPEPGAE